MVVGASVLFCVFMGAKVGANLLSDVGLPSVAQAGPSTHILVVRVFQMTRARVGSTKET